MRSRSAAAHQALPAAAAVGLDPLPALGGRVRPALGGALRGGAEVIVRPGSSRSPARLRTSSSSRTWASRSTSVIPASSSATAGLAATSARASSRRRRRPVERRAQLVRRVGDEVLLAAQQPGHPAGHLVEGPRERALLGAALDRRARLEVAARHPARRLVEPAHRARDLPAMTSPATSPTPRTSMPMSARPTIVRRTARCTAATLWVTRTAPTRRPGALRIGTAVASRLAQRVAVARALVAPAGEGGRDLGAAGGRSLRAARPVLSASSAPVGVDHDHAPADRRARSRHERLQLGAARGREEVGGGGGDDVGLRARLRADLVVDAPADARGQRDLERDDRQQQDVGERQQQAGAEAHAAAASRSSGAPRRNPTPRTVCR